MSNAAALNARIADVFSAFRAAGQPLTVAHAQDALGWRFQPVWEVEQLVAKGALRRVENTPGVHAVDSRYEARPSREWR
jgi:hypothetical protein